ncbi:SWI/SNF helicase family protein [Desulforapulum autotrophicum HRM2]|uniref:SWI/SNF helicase family protein n=1 Tax=Desulforapulum autotrophicum (strain ATCC 43914 / DSM 3382 / VKM B-1955 / HRM2) TaxID=177437 RepID=C0QD97_DESAH|nr:DEAD/DEAH box helicase [Desulforapulum autotrophicum]ACN13135.1 SWI/SNF helicase family protein [Desulforapulum autotrophicum HRM2]
MEKKNNPVARAYRQLDPVLKTMVRILAVQVSELTQKQMGACLNALGLRDQENMPFVQKNLQPLVKALEQQNLLIKKPKGITCPESVWATAVEDAVTTGQFQQIALTLLDAMPIQRSPNGYFFRRLEDFYRAFQMAVYGGDTRFDLDVVHRSGNFYFPMAFQENPPVQVLFNRPFQPLIFDCMAPKTRLKIIEYILESAGRNLEPVGDALEYGVALLSKTPGLETSHGILTWLLFRGEIARLQAISGRLKASPSVSASMGWGKVICGDNDGALTCFNAALAAIKKNTRKRKVFLTGYEGLFFLFALLKSTADDDHRAALACIDIADKEKNPCLPVMVAMKPMFQEKLGLVAPVYDSLDHCIEQNHAVISFLSILVMTWTDKKRAKSHISILESVRERAFRSGLRWIEAEASALLAELGEEVEINGKRSEKIHQACGTKTLATLVKPVSLWEKNLNSLIHIGEALTQKPKAEADYRELRLVWLMQHSEKYNTCHITPRLQKRSKDNTWTKGRPVALKKLYGAYPTMEGLTDQDRQVASAIVEESFRSGYRYGYRKIDYRFDGDKALPALVGHPLIFIGAALESPVELVMGAPEVSFRIQDGMINVQMKPRPIDEIYNVLVVRETPSRFKVVRFSAEHLKIARILGEKGLDLPEEAEEMATQAIASISSLVTVNSDLSAGSGGQVREIAADPTPHVHIMPCQKGIKIEFLIRPFTHTGSYFRPGRGGINVFADVKGEKVQAIRDMRLEKERSRAVISQCPTLDRLEEVGGQWLVEDPEEALELLFELKNHREEMVIEWPQGEKMQVSSHQVAFDDFKLSVKKDREWFKATGTFTIDENLTLDLSRLMELLDNPSGRFIPMDDGTFLAITLALKERLEELKAYSIPHGKGFRFAPLAAPAIEELTGQVGSLKSDKAWTTHCRKLKEVINPELPGTLQACLRDYQVDGFNWLAQLVHWQVGACLADDMGLGKTVQALAAILLHAGDGPTLVVAPLSVMANWQDECHCFTPTLNPIVFGPGDRQKVLDNLGPFDLLISSYGLLQVAAEQLAGVTWQTIVLDEAQAIKNMRTKRSKAAMKLSAGFRMITTGTPVENHLDELWTLFNFLNPGLLGTFNHFKNAFAIPIERDQDKKASGRLKKLIRPFILRRMKTHVLKELPEKTEITLQVEMSQDERVLYEAHRLKAVENIEAAEDTPGQKHLRILAELTKLRQLCCNPSLVLPGTKITSSKLKVFGDMVDELLENNHKALVFSQFVGHLAILKKFLDAKKISYQYLDGSTRAGQRRERINAFQSGVGELFLISLKAGGFGLNLTAADYVIHMDPWWNPAVEDQASDRAYRIGQTRPVTVYRLVVKGSIEERILDLHREKRDLAESLLTGSDMAGKISAEDLLGFLRQEG